MNSEEKISFPITLIKKDDWSSYGRKWRCDALQIPTAEIDEIYEEVRRVHPQDYTRSGNFIVWNLPSVPDELKVQISIAKGILRLPEEKKNLEARNRKLEEEKLNLEEKNTKISHKLKRLQILATLSVPLISFLLSRIPNSQILVNQSAVLSSTAQSSFSKIPTLDTFENDFKFEYNIVGINSKSDCGDQSGEGLKYPVFIPYTVDTLRQVKELCETARLAYNYPDLIQIATLRGEKRANEFVAFIKERFPDHSSDIRRGVGEE